MVLVEAVVRLFQVVHISSSHTILLSQFVAQLLLLTEQDALLEAIGCVPHQELAEADGKRLVLGALQWLSPGWHRHRVCLVAPQQMTDSLLILIAVPASVIVSVEVAERQPGHAELLVREVQLASQPHELPLTQGVLGDILRPPNPLHSGPKGSLQLVLVQAGTFLRVLYFTTAHHGSWNRPPPHPVAPSRFSTMFLCTTLALCCTSRSVGLSRRNRLQRGITMVWCP
mmetsp:Transcript_61378/g.179391  ORF Transcript_61378/g.179391 Transcript_61378/m.179391 type:complete len:228 (-) Transcript_61378:428-1111(-)